MQDRVIKNKKCGNEAKYYIKKCGNVTK